MWGKSTKHYFYISQIMPKIVLWKKKMKLKKQKKLVRVTPVVKSRISQTSTRWLTLPKLSEKCNSDIKIVIRIHCIGIYSVQLSECHSCNFNFVVCHFVKIFCSFEKLCQFGNSYFFAHIFKTTQKKKNLKASKNIEKKYEKRRSQST